MSEQTAIIAEDRLFAGVGGHTQIDGALIAARSGVLLIDTRTLGFSDIEERIVERVQDVQLGVNLGWGGDATGTERPGQGLPGATLSGQLASRDVERITRATVGPGQIVVRDEEAQTQDLAALNRDLDRAQEVIRDEAAGVRFYASDTAIMEIASGFATTRENLRLLGDRLGEALAGLSEQRREEAASLADALQASDDLDTAAAKIAEELVARGEIAPEAQEETRQTLARAAAEALTDPEANAQLAACVAGGRQGFNLHDWLFPRAHAAAPPIAIGAAMSPGVVQACGQAAVALGALALGLWNQWQVLNNDANDAGTGPGMGHNQPPADSLDNDQANPNPPPQGPRPPVAPFVVGGAFLGLSGDTPQNVALTQRLAQHLRLESANSPFTSDGRLTQEAILSAEQIVSPINVKNPRIPSGFAKYTTPTFQSPSGEFQVHFYKNPSTGQVFYGLDYKIKFNRVIGR